jgi:hypothetical protein
MARRKQAMTETIHVYTEADSKASLLAELHRLQSSLAAMRQARDLHGANSAERMRQVDRLQEQVRMLREALDSLMHEVCGWLGLYGEYLRPYSGNTNIAVMKHKVEQARAALAATEPKP